MALFGNFTKEVHERVKGGSEDKTSWRIYESDMDYFLDAVVVSSRWTKGHFTHETEGPRPFILRSLIGRKRPS